MIAIQIYRGFKEQMLLPADRQASNEGWLGRVTKSVPPFGTRRVLENTAP